VGQAYNPNTGAYAATHQVANAYGTAGSSVVSKNGQTAYTQHQTTAQGSVGSVDTSAGGLGVAAAGSNGNTAAAGQIANGNKYAAANGNVYKNTAALTGRGRKVDRRVLEDGMSLRHLRVVIANWVVPLALFPLAACNNNKQPDKPSTKVFASPDDAGNATIAAAKSGDRSTILAIFGRGSEDVLYSGDAVDDKNSADALVAKYGAMRRWRTLQDGSQILIVGADNYPFAIPLKKNADGQWFFDTAAGKNEVLSRRVGRNELAVIDVCEAIADAQAEYYSKSHDGQAVKHYAAKFISDAGRQNGLYWKSEDGRPASPLGPMAAFASAEGYKVNPNGHTPFHGYYFQMLKGQTDKAPGGAKDYAVNGKMTNGFAFVAYPAQYGNSGVMTFIANQDGVLLQKDLGKDTRETATEMTMFDPDPAGALFSNDWLPPNLSVGKLMQ
jgi:hypothetical protein